MENDRGVDGLLAALELKSEERTGWGLRGVEDPESVASHSWGTALLTLLFAEEAGVDRSEALRMAVVHDLPEAVTGDLLPPGHPDGSYGEEKKEAEREAARVLSEAGISSATETWRSYEERESPEALFVKDMDLCDMALQALVYLREGEAAAEELKEFVESAEEGVRTETGRGLIRRISGAFDSASL